MMSESVKVVNELRRSTRVKDRSRLSWHVKDSEFMGQGRVVNISSSGMLIEANSVFAPTINSFLTMNPLAAKNIFIPQFGRIVWHRRIKAAKDKMLFGIEFVNPAKEAVDALVKKVQRSLTRDKVMRVVSFLTEALFIFAILALTGFVLWMGASIYKDLNTSSQTMLSTSTHQATLARNYAAMYQESQNQLNLATNELNRTNTMLQSVSRDLQATKVILAETETLLAQAKADMQGMSAAHAKETAAQAQRTEAVKNELNAKIALLQEQSVQLKKEMVGLQDKLDYYEGKIGTLDEGYALMQLYRERMKMVKNKIRAFRKEAAAARAAAMKERDRLKSLLGNNGYFMRDGSQVQVDMEKYNAVDDGNIMIPEAKGDVKINVEFVE